MNAGNYALVSDSQYQALISELERIDFWHPAAVNRRINNHLTEWWKQREQEKST